jgi:RNA polymerase sigma factor (sigma-70 family)
MASGLTGALQRDMGALFDAGTMTGLTDRDLVERFSGPRTAAAEAAFEVLVTRHGPMVLRVCRNVLRDLDDAQDAFQATFIVLVKQRGAIRKLDSVGSWLYGVASRVAARARVDAARRRKAEERGIRLASESVMPTAGVEETDLDAFGPIVQQEVSRLPEKYRSVVVLCFWEGMTHEQAASQLGCPLGTVRSRMARARDLLRRRLARRGIAPATGAIAALFDPAGALAAIRLAPLSPTLVRSSVRAAMQVAAGKASAEVVSAGAALLVRRVLWSMTMMKLKNLAAVLMAGGLFVLGATLWAQQPRHERRQDFRNREYKAVTEDAKKPAGVKRTNLVHVVEPPDMLLVEVLEALPGRPISGERLVRPDGTISLGFYGDVEVAGLTIPEAKEKIVLHLKKYLSDDGLGLIEHDPDTNEPKADSSGQLCTIDPKKTDRVFVDVTAYNSRNYYVEGEVASPGRLPFTGSDRVLDAIHYAGGLLSWADEGKIQLIRSFPKGSPVQVLPIDYHEIAMGTDSSTNYEILPFDRLVVPRNPSISKPLPEAPVPTAKGQDQTSGKTDLDVRFNRKAFTQSDLTGASQRVLERRLDEMEKKLDAILKKLGDRKP